MGERKAVVPDVRFISSVSAGFPSPGEDWKENTLNLHNLVVKHPISTYFLKVAGDSMIGACIYQGDILVVDRAVTAANKKIVVARLGDGFTVKRLLLGKGRMVLNPENPAYKPVEVTNRKDFEIWGLLPLSCIRLSNHRRELIS